MSKFFILIAFVLLLLEQRVFCNPRVVCYFSSWTVYRPDDGKYTVDAVDPNLCTHIIYAFVGLQTDGTVELLDDWAANGLHQIQDLLNLKQVNPNLKVMVSMGGWNEGSTKYSQVIGNAGLRSTLVQSIVDFVVKYNFDGFDLDWEYPNQRGGVPSDVQDYVSFLQQAKQALGAKGLLLSAAVAGGVPSEDLSYNFVQVSQNVDFLNVMAYDFHGAFENFVGHVAPLKPSHLDTTPDEQLVNVQAGVQHWLDKGADPAKLNLGLALYGRGFTLQDPSNTSLYAPVTGPCAAGPYTREAGILGYNEICAFDGAWQKSFDDEQEVPHIVNAGQWVGYEDTQSLKLKVDYAKQKGLGGVMVWSLDTDDFKGICGPKYPLLTAVNQELNG